MLLGYAAIRAYAPPCLDKKILVVHFCRLLPNPLVQHATLDFKYEIKYLN